MVKVLDVVSRVLWVLVLVGAGVAATGFWGVYSDKVLFRSDPDMNAPQLAALCAETLVFAVVPYVIARAFDRATRPRRAQP